MCSRGGLPRGKQGFEVVDRPAAKPVITSKWVFKKKKGVSRKVEKYKARLVARGFMQEEGVDYTLKKRKKTYSPTARFESIRMMTAAAPSGEFVRTTPSNH